MGGKKRKKDRISREVEPVAVPEPPPTEGGAAQCVPAFRGVDWLLAALLVVSVFVAFWPSVAGDYLWDDQLIAQKSAQGPWTLWFDLDALDREDPRYWPALYTSFWIEDQLWGGPRGYHITNIALHAANALLVLLVLRRLALPGAWIAAFLFALHPTRVETVAWMIERKGVLSGFFALLSAWAFLAFRQRRSRGLYALALGAFGLALLAKPVVVTLPVVLALLIYWKQGSLRAPEIKQLVPFFLLAIADGLLILSLAGQHAAATPGLALWERLLLSGRSAWFYFQQLFWPHPLLTVYPKWDLRGQAGLGALLGVLLLGAGGMLFWKRHRLGRGPLVAFLFFLVCLGPSLGLIEHSFLNRSYVADRFGYLAAIAVFAAVGVLWARVPMLAKTKGLVAGAVLVVVIFGPWTSRQSGYYVDQRALFGHTLEHYDGSELAHHNYAKALTDLREDELAIHHYERALELNPKYVKALSNLAGVLGRRGQPGDRPRAFELAQEAIAIDPLHARSHYHLGILHEIQGKPAEAIQCYRRVLEIDPSNRLARRSLDRLSQGRR